MVGGRELVIQGLSAYIGVWPTRLLLVHCRPRNGAIYYCNRLSDCVRMRANDWQDWCDATKTSSLGPFLSINSIIFRHSFIVMSAMRSLANHFAIVYSIRLFETIASRGCMIFVFLLSRLISSVWRVISSSDLCCENRRLAVLKREWSNWNRYSGVVKAHPDRRSIPTVSPINCKHQRRHAVWTALAHRRRRHLRWRPPYPRARCNRRRPFMIHTIVWIRAVPLARVHMYRHVRCARPVAVIRSLRTTWRPSNRPNHIPFRILLVHCKNCPKIRMSPHANWWCCRCRRHQMLQRRPQKLR